MRVAERDRLPLTEAETAALFAPLRGWKRLGLAVSGGADSTALMVLAARWPRTLPDAPELTVLTVDHGLRSESAEEAETVRRWAGQAELDCVVLQWRPDGHGGNLQAQAREARYSLMAQACLERGIEAVVTAHHLDDQAETFLLRLARGSGVDGLSAMDEVAQVFGVTILRPLLDVPRARLQATLDQLRHPYMDDPSNASDRFARVRLRALANELAGEGLSPARLAATARRMRRARKALDAATDRLVQEVAQLDRIGIGRLKNRLVGCDDELAMRLLARMVMAVSGAALPPPEAGIERLLHTLRHRSAGGQTLAGCRMALRRDGAVFFREEGRTGLPEIKAGPGEVHIWDNRFRVAIMNGAPRFAIRALGADGVAQIRAAGEKMGIAPRIAATVPSLWRHGRLVHVPGILRNGTDFGDGTVAIYQRLGEIVRTF